MDRGTPSTNELMRGGCYALALYLHRRTGLPLHGLFDEAGSEGSMHHAYVFDAASGLAYDARGAVRLDRIAVFRREEGTGRFPGPAKRADVRALEEDAKLAWSARQLRDYCLADPDLAGMLS